MISKKVLALYRAAVNWKDSDLNVKKLLPSQQPPKEVVSSIKQEELDTWYVCKEDPFEANSSDKEISDAKTNQNNVNVYYSVM